MLSGTLPPEEDLFGSLGVLGDPRTLGTRCGVYHCTLLVDEHSIDITDDGWDWENVTHFNEDERVGFIAPMPREWRD